ncbi:MAG: VOC family protein [Dehalococcoidia bacterium]|nr:VOC family protein [Dehalococcoidia bacterium]
MPKARRVDHVSMAVPDLDQTLEFFHRLFDVQPDRVKRFKTDDFDGAIFRVGESKWELLAPSGPESFLARFLATRGAGFHHVTVHVESLEETTRLLTERGIPWFEQTTPEGIREVFIHPKNAYGVLIQLLDRVWEDIPDPA